MDTVRAVILTVIGTVTIISLSVLVALGKDDVVALGVITTIAVQIVNLVSTQTVGTHVNTVASRVNGHMKTLIQAKTLSTDDGEAIAHEGTNPNV